MKMKLAVLLAILVLGIASCGGDNTSNAGGNAANKPANTSNANK
jgi:hypothetical protein